MVKPYRGTFIFSKVLILSYEQFLFADVFKILDEMRNFILFDD